MSRRSLFSARFMALAALPALALAAVATTSTSASVDLPVDSQTDSCEFIRAQIQRAPERGARIPVPAGVFECARPVVIDRSGIELVGAGQDRSTLRLRDNSHSPLLVIGDARVIQREDGQWVPATRVREVVVSDLTLDGNLANQDPNKECGNSHCEGDVTTIRNNALTIRGASDIRVENVTAKNSISGGMVTEKFCDRLFVKNFTAYGHHFDGFAGYQTEDSVFENMNLSRNRAAGISIDIAFNKNHFKGGRLEKNGDVGIFARDVHGVIFEGLEIRDSGSHGAYLSDAGDPNTTCTTGNEFRSVKIENSNGFGIYLGGPCRGNRLTGESVLKDNKQGCTFVHPGGELEASRSVNCSDQ